MGYKKLFTFIYFNIFHVHVVRQKLEIFLSKSDNFIEKKKLR